MSLTAGSRLGPYDIVALLGAGGMGEVYRARDSKLNRDVALKILPESFANDSDRLARFRREAQVLASLNHPNIAQIYGFEDSSATHALVMELVEGPTLADLIDVGRGLQTPGAPGSKDPGLHLKDALAIARQIADALEAAHEQGIIHRDLKPANVKVRDDGTVKVLDFGLAKALDPGSKDPGLHQDAANSPTLTTPAMTAMGMILGTAAYMSPEQAKGRVVDKRADIWAFGVVFYEMLAGRALFDGDSVAETIGFVATRDPDWTTLPASTPASVRRLLARCLTRDPKHRLRDIGEARIALAAAEADGPAFESTSLPVAPTAQRPRAAFTAAAAVLIALALAGGWYWGSRGGVAPIAVAPLHAEIVPTPTDAFARGSSPRVFTFTPDGSALIYASGPPGPLYRRDRVAQVAVPIAGTENAYGPFVSPDSSRIGFFADGKLKWLPAGGGAAQLIHDMRSPSAPDALAFGWGSEVGPGREVGYGATWLPDDTIVYGRFFGGLWRVSLTGGTPTPLTTSLPDGEIAHRLPHALPGGRAIVCTVVRSLLATLGSSVEAVDLVSGARTKLVDDATDGRYAPGGYLLFARAGALYSVRFDPALLKISGEPVKISDDVMHAVGGSSPGSASGTAQYDVSADGTLAVLRGGTILVRARQLGWVAREGTREGKVDPVQVEPADYLGPRISPDGTRIAVWMATDVRIIGVRDGIATPLLKDAIFPVWTPDESRVMVALRGQRARQEIYSVPLSGGAPEPVVTGPNPLWPSSVSRDGKFLAYVESNPKTGNDIWVVGLTPKTAPAAVLTTASSETHPMFSPDGKWLMYVVDDVGSSEIYVRPFPGPGRGERVSRNGGIAPVWARDGQSILYGSVTRPGQFSIREIVRASIDTSGGRIRVGPSEVFMSGRFFWSTPVSGFDVSLDGTRVLAVMAVSPPSGAPPTPPPAAPTLQLTVHANLAGAGRE